MVYVRKTTRASWTAEDLKTAIDSVKEGVPIREAARDNKIPERTLRRRIIIQQNSQSNRICLGRGPILGCQVETKLSLHISKLQAAGFAPTKNVITRLAYQLSVAMGIQTPFNEKKERAGKDWFRNFMRRNPQLSIRIPQGVSSARAQGMNTEDVAAYFDLLKQTLLENNLMNKPGNIFNMDETGVQLNNEPGKVIAMTGSKNVHVITSSERGETITIIACCNAEGTFLPPYCVMKGVNTKAEYKDGLIPGSAIKMNKKSAYSNSVIFMDWLKTHFVPRKPEGKVLLILDGHISHMNDCEMLDFAAENDVILLCLPSHTTHWLQPLDRAFFKSLKAYWRDACNSFVVANPGRKINRLQFGHLLSNAWRRAATLQNGESGFSATGIYPFNPDVIPDRAFLTSQPLDNTGTPSTSSSSTTPSTSSDNSFPVCSTSTSTSTVSVTPGASNDISPTKLINTFCKIPVLPARSNTIKKQTAMIVTRDVVQKKANKVGQQQKAKVNKSHADNLVRSNDNDEFEADDPAPLSKRKLFKNEDNVNKQQKRNRTKVTKNNSDKFVNSNENDEPEATDTVPLKNNKLPKNPGNVGKQQKRKRSRAMKYRLDDLISSDEDDNSELDDPLPLKKKRKPLEFVDDGDSSYSETFSDLENPEVDDDNLEDLTIEMFILARFRFKEGKGEKVFVGQITEIDADSNILTVKSLRYNKRTNSFFFPAKDDVTEVPYGDVIRKLQPQVSAIATKRQNRFFNFGVDFRGFQNMY